MLLFIFRNLNYAKNERNHKQVCGFSHNKTIFQIISEGYFKNINKRETQQASDRIRERQLCDFDAKHYRSL